MPNTLNPACAEPTPAEGGNIDVFIERRIFGFRLTIATDEVVIVIDIP